MGSDEDRETLRANALKAADTILKSLSRLTEEDKSDLERYMDSNDTKWCDRCKGTGKYQSWKRAGVRTVGYLIPVVGQLTWLIQGIKNKDKWGRSDCVKCGGKRQYWKPFGE